MSSAYTPDQIERFISLIKLPPKYHPTKNPAKDLAFLTNLHVHTISTLPYENLGWHYCTTKDYWKLSLAPEDLYQKFVGDGRGRGGYCMELSLFYTQVRSYG